MEEIEKITQLLNSAKAVFTNDYVTESYKNKIHESLKELLKTSQELLSSTAL